MDRIIRLVRGRYEASALKEVMRRLRRHAAAGRDSSPDRVQIQTQTLRYARVHWLAITGLVEHWCDATIEAVRAHPSFGPAGATSTRLVVTAAGVRSFTAEPAPSFAGVSVEINGYCVPPPTTFDPTAPASFELISSGEWRWVPPLPRSPLVASLVKQPGLQGPIDDAFMSSFAFVTPEAMSGEPAPSAVDRWVNFELAHAVHRWEAVFRGTPIMHVPTYSLCMITLCHTAALQPHEYNIVGSLTDIFKWV